jgi:predicted outer membrane repeat protein
MTHGLSPSPVRGAVFCVDSPAALRDAFTQAAANGADDEVRLRSGTYAGSFRYQSSENRSLAVSGGWDAGCAARGDDPSLTVMDGEGSARPLEFAGSVLFTARVENLSFRGGYVLGRGGGVNASGCSLTVDGCRFQGNRASDKGGAIAVEGSSHPRPTLLVTDSLLEENSGNGGGGVYAQNVFAVTLTGNTLAGNVARNDVGGGLYVFVGDAVTVTGNVFRENAAPGHGGGALLFAGALLINGNLFQDNLVESPYYAGGALFLNGISSTLVSNTFVGNRAGEGGGLYVSILKDAHWARLVNNLFAGNAASTAADISLHNNDDNYGGYSPVTMLHNMADWSPSGFVIRQPGYPVDASNLPAADPRFLDPAAGNYRLGGDSPCLGAGLSSEANLPPTDLDGRPRVVGVVDLGAYEQPPAPPAPTGLTASDGTSREGVLLAWTGVDGEDGYRILRADAAGGPYVQVGLAGPDAVSHLDPLPCRSGTFHYRVAAFTYGGDSAPTAPDEGWVAACPAPGAPGGVRASDGLLAGVVRVSWEAADHAGEYLVWTAPESAGDYTLVAVVPWDSLAADLSRPCDGLTAWYRVTARNDYGESAPSAADAGSIAPCPVPASPAHLTASDDSHRDLVLISWSGTEWALDYVVWWSADGEGTYQEAGTVPAPATSLELPFPCGQSGWFRVTARNATGESPLSNADAGSTSSCLTPPVPSGVAAGDGSFLDRVEVTWSDGEGEEGYRVYGAGAAGGPWTLLGSVGADTTLFTDPLPCGTLRHYRVAAWNSFGESAPSASDPGSTADCPVPPAPGGVAAGDGLLPDGVEVTWNDGEGEEEYLVYRSDLAEGPYALLGSTAAGVTTYLDAVPCGSPVRHYRVTARNGYGESDPSPADAGFPQACPPVPLYADDFDDGVLFDGGWRKVSGRWRLSGRGDRFLAAGSSGQGIILLRRSPAACRLETAVRLAPGGTPNADLLFAYRGKGAYRYVGLRPGRILIGQKGSVGSVKKGSVRTSRRAPLSAGTWHDLRVDVLPDGRVKVYLDGGTKPAATARFPDVVAGPPGLGVQASPALFDDLFLWGPDLLPGSGLEMSVPSP